MLTIEQVDYLMLLVEREIKGVEYGVSQHDRENLYHHSIGAGNRGHELRQKRSRAYALRDALSQLQAKAIGGASTLAPMEDSNAS